MLRRTLFTTLAGIAGLTGLAAWYARPIVHARLVGVDWRGTVRASTCSTTRREVWCTTLRVPPGIGDSYTTLQLNPVTRGINRISRNWAFADSVGWKAMIDSTRRVMRIRHGEPLPCETWETGFKLTQAWRFGAEEARLYASQISATVTQPQFWFLSLQLVPLDAPACGRPHYVILGPAEIAQQVHDWLTVHLGF
jgi:hypothetical protein